MAENFVQNKNKREDILKWQQMCIGFTNTTINELDSM